MVIFAGSGYARKSGVIASLAFSWVMPVLAGLLVLSIVLASAADAKRRHKKRRHVYSPPRASLVLDANSGKILHSHNIDALRYPASITKVMTLYLLFEQLKLKRLSLDTELTVSEFASNQSPSKLGLKPGNTITVRDAMYSLVTKSANDAAVVIAENLAGSEAKFARFMTKRARALGMTKTTFRNASGLPDSGQRTTARDLIILAQHVTRNFPKRAKIFHTRTFKYKKKSFRNHNGLLFTYPGCEGLKTGYTRASGFNLLASVKRGDKHLLAVVLGGSSARVRNARMRGLLNKAWKKAVRKKDMKKLAPILASAGQKTKLASGSSSGSKGKKLHIAQEDMPEPNPAFHPSAGERTLIATLNKKRQAAMQSRTARRKPASTHQRQVAMATVAPRLQPQARTPNSSAVVKSPTEITITPSGVAPSPASASKEASAPAAEVPATDPPGSLGPYHVQVGSYVEIGAAKKLLQKISANDGAAKLLKGHKELTVAGVVKGTTYYRARYGSFSKDEARQTCRKLKAMKFQCLALQAE
jgi:D-alanyl-D-alanine carboxypeptidase